MYNCFVGDRLCICSKPLIYRDINIDDVSDPLITACIALNQLYETYTTRV